MLTRRTQILLDEERYARLRDRAEEDGSSIAALIRESIDQAFPPVPAERRQAATAHLRALQAEPLDDGEQEDWSTLKRRSRDQQAAIDRERR